MPKSLTRDEAAARSALVSVSSYDVSLDLTGPDDVFRAETVVRFRCSDDGAATWLDLIAPEVVELEINGQRRDPAGLHVDDRLHLDGLQTDNVVRVVVDAAYMRTGEGLHRFVDPVDGAVYLYTQFEEMDARRVFACFDQPDLKATFTLTVTAPETWQVVSNGRTDGEPQPVDGGRRHRFRTTPRLSTYVTALVAGPYHQVTGELTSSDGRTVPLGVWCRASMAEHLDADDVLELTRQGFAFFEDWFAMAYPFDKYDQLFVPEFNAGAMENAACVTISESYVFRSRVTRGAYENRANTILHELAHMWFGDLVTMRWWDDLWLNESFAEWASYLAMATATEYVDAWTGFAADRKAWAYVEDQLPSTHPIAADMVDLEAVALNFDGITYAKGASALRQLVAYVGEDDFRTGIRAYFREHAWGNASLADLFRALETASGRDLGTWIEQWLGTAGVSTLLPDAPVGADGSYEQVAVRQVPPADHPHLRPHRMRVGLYDLDGGGADPWLALRRQVELDVDGERTVVDGLGGEPAADLVLVNDGDLTYAKVRFDQRSLATLRDHLHRLPDPLSRAVCWLAAIDLLRDAELPARDFVTLVLDSIGPETSDPVVRRVLPTGRSAIHLYADPSTRLELASRWTSGLRSLLLRAEPGSDRQLAFARAWAASAASPDDAAALTGLLDGSAVPDGLAVDTDLRWALVSRLAAVGVAGEEVIGAELERDQTSAGEQHAAYARAAVPTAEAKAEVWQRCVVEGDVPTAILAKMLAGFGQPEQRELLRPYVEPYFDHVERVWAERTPETAHKIVEMLFPRLLAEPATLQATERWEARTDASPGLRRMVGEGRADVERALRAQACDAAADGDSRGAALVPDDADAPLDSPLVTRD